MRITALNFRLLYNAEFIQYFNNLVAFYNAADAAVKTAVAAQLSPLVAILARIDQLFKTDTQSPLTKPLTDLDAKRDSYLGGISTVCEGFRSHPDVAIAAAAATLAHSIDVYGGAVRMSESAYNAETASIDNMITDWTSKPDLAAAVAKLKIGDWVTALQMVNKDFNHTYTTRTTDIATTATSDTVKSKREEAMHAWYNLRDVTEANRTLATNKAPWDALIAQINQQSAEYSKILAARGGRAAKKNNDKNSTGNAQGGE